MISLLHAAQKESINPSDGINDWLITFVLLPTAFSLLLEAMVVKYYMKRGLTIYRALSEDNKKISIPK